MRHLESEYRAQPLQSTASLKLLILVLLIVHLVGYSLFYATAF